MKKILLFFIVFTIVYSTSNAALLQAQSSNVIKHDNIGQLLEVRANIAQKSRTIPGYRVQIIQDNNRELVREQKAALLKMFPDIRAYETYDAPFFKLRLGDFKDRFEAYRVFYEAKKEFKRSFIVQDKINISEL